MTDFWKIEHLATDQINADIWQQSPELQRQVQTPRSLVDVGSVGAQQAMIEGEPDCVLPWVPDLIGKDWKDSGAILVVGSAYAGFIKEYSGRPASMPLSSYHREQTVDKFQCKFLQTVVMPDCSYYSKIPALLPQDWDSSKIALFDLCRASLVQRANGLKRKDTQGDGVIKKQPHIFHEYATNAQAAEWTWQRIIQSTAYRIVALGTIAEHGLLRLFASHGMKAFVECQPQIRFGPARVTTSANWPLGYAGRSGGRNWILGNWCATDSYWVVEGVIAGQKRTWYVRPTNHPADVHSGTHPSLAATRSALVAMEQMKPQII